MKNVFLGALLFCGSAGLHGAAEGIANEPVTVLATAEELYGVVIVIDFTSFEMGTNAEAFAEMLRGHQAKKGYRFGFVFSFDRGREPEYALIDQVFSYASNGSYASQSRNFRHIPFPTDPDGFIGLMNSHQRQHVILIAQSSHVPQIVSASMEHGFEVLTLRASMDVEGEETSPVDELAGLLGKLGL